MNTQPNQPQWASGAGILIQNLIKERIQDSISERKRGERARVEKQRLDATLPQTSNHHQEHRL